MKTIERPTQTGNHPHIGGSGPSLYGADSLREPQKLIEEIDKDIFSTSIGVMLLNKLRENGMNPEVLLMNTHIFQKMLPGFINEFKALIGSSEIRPVKDNTYKSLAVLAGDKVSLGDHITDQNFPIRELSKKILLHSRPLSNKIKDTGYNEIEEYFNKLGYRFAGIEHLFDVVENLDYGHMPIMAMRDYFMQGEEYYFPTLAFNKSLCRIDLFPKSLLSEVKILLIKNRVE
jgi:hypothetical protein